MPFFVSTRYLHTPDSHSEIPDKKKKGRLTGFTLLPTLIKLTNCKPL